MTVNPDTKKFGLWTLTFLVIANMVGAGVFTTSGFTLNDLGTPRLVIAAWIVGGMIAMAGAASYGQLARLMPESGGEYLFLSRAAHPLFGFIAGWVSLIAGFSGAIALSAVAFEAYTVPESAVPDDALPWWIPRGSVAVLVILAAGVFHGFRPRVGAVLQNTIVLLKLGLIAGILAFAATMLNEHEWSGRGLGQSPTGVWPVTSAFATSLVWISLSYSGFNAAVYVADEAKNAMVTVRRAMLLGTAIVFVLYVLLNSIFVCAPPPENIAGHEDVAAIAAQFLGGSSFATFVRITISAALLTSVLSMMMAAPRVYAKMADDGLMPGFLRFQGDAPRFAIIVQVVLAIMLVLVMTLRGLLSYLGLTLSLSAACSVACLFLPKVRRRPLFHPAHALPMLYIFCTFAAALIMAIREPKQMIGTALTVSVGAAVYFVVRQKGNAHNRRD